MISFIWAQTNQGVIGNQQQLPWHIKAELNNFKKITLNHKIIMGRKTWNSINRPLPNRENIVISQNPNLKLPDNVVLINDINQLITKYQNSKEEVFVIGGAMIFGLLVNYVNKLYVSFIKENFIGDVYMIKINYDLFNLLSTEEYSDFTLKIYKKNKV